MKNSIVKMARFVWVIICSVIIMAGVNLWASDHPGDDPLPMKPADLSPDMNKDCVVNDKDALIMLDEWLETVVGTIGNGLIGYWDFDDGAPLLALDGSGNENHGTINGAAQYVAGISGQALSFDGVNDYVEVLDDAALRVETGEITLSAWVFYQGQENSTQCVLRKFLSTNGGFGSYTLWRFGNGFHGNVQNQSLNAYPGWNGSESIELDQWHHIVYRWKKQFCDQRDAQLFLDGNPIDSSYSPGPGGYPANFSIGYSSGSLYFGREVPSVSGVFFKGRLDEIRIYNRSLPDKEVHYLYAAPGGEGTLPADLNWDGIVNLNDYAILSAHWLEQVAGCQ